MTLLVTLDTDRNRKVLKAHHMTLMVTAYTEKKRKVAKAHHIS